MSRSIHTTKKDLEIERKFALQDHVDSEESITEQEEKALRKAIVKTNEDWKREAEAMNSYGSMVITRVGGEIGKVFQIRKLSTDKTE